MCCAIDIYGNTILKVGDIGRITSNTLIKIFDGKIDQDSEVITDSHKSYHKLMSKLGVVWIKIPSKKKSLGSYTLERINHLHALLKDFTYKYKGISQKYLQGYLALFDYKNKHRTYYKESELHATILDIVSTRGHLKCSILDSDRQIYT